ncbi:MULTISPECIES: calcium/sodium antiporter [unclassified Modestobacter]|uniref:calcium/sodium antiporter n=1 Tax=unclassified Modestobacter TaxID=2643866 RepID=UPI0022AB02A7|nr:MULTISPECIES: calcium/sodium antiporter [unclassified Modestobacter]MCZ2825492.1 calcium/sodium antiporter [Modestobacter sp. VKM Ac-2981]MCZ2853443.1 calcium/sodium antiporter [Modestobacter sp. VKM Ac-2982]
MTVIELLAGLALLTVGGEFLVRGGSALGRAAGISPLVIGLTVVAFATAAPELAVSLDAALTGAAGLAVGNVVGSNIANVLLVGGLTALAAPLAVDRGLLRGDVPALLALSVLLLVLAADGTVALWEGILLVALAAGYLGWKVRAGRREGAPEESEGAPEETGAARPPVRPRSFLPPAGSLLAGLALLVVGARLLVDAATTIASALGLSDLVIGLTVVAVGTSLPELATSVVAAVRGQREMALGNIVGSNVLNIGMVLGLTAVVAPGGLPVDPSALRFDVPVMIVVALALVPLLLTHATLARWEGGLLLAWYAVYVTVLVLSAIDSSAAPAVTAVALWGLLPLTVVGLAVLTAREVGRRRRAAAAR